MSNHIIHKALNPKIHSGIVVQLACGVKVQSGVWYTQHEPSVTCPACIVRMQTEPRESDATKA